MSQQINLYNPLFLRREKYFSAKTMLQALGLIFLGVAGLYVFAVVQTRSSERVVQDYRAQVASQREQLVKLGTALSPQARSKALEADIARPEAEIKARRSMLTVLSTGELGNTEGVSPFFAAFGRQSIAGVWLTGFTVGEGGNDLQVRGRALHAELVPAYLRALNNEEMMRGRRVTELKLAAKAAAAAPRAPGAAKAPSAGPERFVEFTLAAPLRLAEAKPAAKGARP